MRCSGVSLCVLVSLCVRWKLSWPVLCVSVSLREFVLAVGYGLVSRDGGENKSCCGVAIRSVLECTYIHTCAVPCRTRMCSSGLVRGGTRWMYCTCTATRWRRQQPHGHGYRHRLRIDMCLALPSLLYLVACLLYPSLTPYSLASNSPLSDRVDLAIA